MAKKKPQPEQPIPTAEQLNGWNWFDTVAQAAQAQTERETGLTSQEIIYHFQQAFSTNHGKIVLSHLFDVIDATEDFDTAQGFYNGAAHGFEKTGARRLFKYIRKLATRGENE